MRSFGDGDAIGSYSMGIRSALDILKYPFQLYVLSDGGEEGVRQEFARMALEGGLRNPILGRGPGTFNYLMPETRMSGYHRLGISHNTDHPHNEPLVWFHDSGVLGLSLFWLMYVVFVRSCIPGLGRSYGYRLAPLRFYLLLSPLLFLLAETFGTDYRDSSQSTIHWTMFGLALAVGRIGGRSDVPAETYRWRSMLAPRAPAFLALGTLFTVLAGMYLAFAQNIWLADHHLRNNMAFTDANQGSIQSALREADAARELNPSNTSNYYKLAYTYLVAGQREDAMNSYRDLQSFAPNYAQIHINLAFLNDQMGFRTASAWERDRAAALENNIKNHRDAAQYWLGLGKMSRALGHMRYGLTFEHERLENGYYFWYDEDNIRA